MSEQFRPWEYARKMERIVGAIFEDNGYQVQYGIDEYPRKEGYRIDIIAQKDARRLAIELKAFRMPRVPFVHIDDAIHRLLYEIDSQGGNFTPVVVVVGLVSQNQKKRIEEVFNSRVLILDIQNLLFMVRNNQVLRDELVSALEYSIDHIVPVEPSIDIEKRTTKVVVSESDMLLQKLSDWKPKKANSAEYELLCCDILKMLFAEDLALWKYQQNSDNGLFRFDMICKIKNGNTKEFWHMCERYFNSKYVVFEFKNYRAKITQKEIFTTVKYLFMKALRGVAIMISVNGTDNHADKAIRGILREEGKLIISLSNEDIAKMLQMKRNKEDPSEYLSGKLDTLLIDLEK